MQCNNRCWVLFFVANSRIGQCFSRASVCELLRNTCEAHYPSISRNKKAKIEDLGGPVCISEHAFDKIDQFF